VTRLSLVRSALLSIVLPCAATAQSSSLSSVERRIEHGVDTLVMRRTTETLASRDMEGRRPGTRGGERAEQWIADRFRELGLEPGGDQKTFFQNVPLIQLAPRAETRLVAGAVTLRWHDDFTFLTQQAPDTAVLTAPVALVRTGGSYEQTPAHDVRGRIVVARVAPGTGSAVFIARAFAERFGPAGALAVVVAGVQPPNRPFAQLVTNNSHPVIRRTDVPPPPAARCPTMLLSDAAALRLYAALGLDSAVASRPVARDAAPVWRDLDSTITLVVRADVQHIVGRNVIGLLRGTDNGAQGTAVVLTAHHDAFGVNADGSVNAGAVDNAIAVGDLLAAARAIVGATARPRHTIIFMATTGEEFGWLGARYWVAHSTWPLARVAADVNLEGDDPGAPLTGRKRFISYNASGADLHEVFANVVHAAGHDTVADPMPAQHAEFHSDAAAFSEAGVPASWIFMFPDTPADAMAAYVRTAQARIHTAADSIVSGWSYAAVRDKAVIAALLTWRLADSPNFPARVTPVLPGLMAPIP